MKNSRWIEYLNHLHSRPFVLLWILLLALLIRGLTAFFIYENISDPTWVQTGTYARFDKQAQDILDRKASLFIIDDPSRTDTAVYPPGYSIWIASIYKITGQRSITMVQTFQWVLDAWSVLLLVAVGVFAFSWRVGIVAGVLAALSPLLAFYGATPLADSPTSWFVTTAALVLLLATKRQSLILALIAGALVGASCWFRGNALLLPLFWVASLLVMTVSWKERLKLAGVVLAGSLLLTAPLLIRNAMAFQVFMPTGLGVGTNLWEGIGETDRAKEFGAVYGDQALLEQERTANNLPADASLYSPNGVERDRERARKAWTVIRSHPVWYAGVMLRRMAGVLKYAGEPGRYYGIPGINVTKKKALPENWQHGAVAVVVTVLGMIQSVLRYVVLPLIAVGIWLALKRDWRVTLLLLSTVLYYLVVGSALHTEIRYGLPMHALLLVFGGLAIVEIYRFANNVRFRRQATHQKVVAAKIKKKK